MKGPRSWTRYIVASVVMLAVALSVSACGGGGDDAAGETTTTRAPATGATTATTASLAAPYSALIGTPLETSDSTPSEVTSALNEHRPLVIFFYVAGGADDAAVLQSLQTLQPTYADVTFLLYEYKNPQAYGSLGTQLMVEYPPQTTFVDTQGIIRAVLGGFADEGTLNQQVVNIRQG